MKACKVQFKRLGKRYYFSCDKMKLQDKDKVVVNTIRGLELGEIVGNTFDIKRDEFQGELKEVLRVATEEDIQAFNDNKELEPAIMQKTKELYN